MAFSGSEEDDYKEVMETLPKEREFRFYGGFWFRDLELPGIMHFQRFFKPRPADIYLMTYPKCGTTWIKAIAFSVLNRNSFSSENHPLLTTHPQKLVPFLHSPFLSSHLLELEQLPSPRLFASHIPFSLLPDPIKDDDFDCRMISVARDPKDVFVSRYFFLKEIRQDQSISLDEALADFCDGYGHFGSIWDSQMEYKRESLRRPGKVLSLNYEDMKESPEDHVRRIAEFIGKPFSEEEEREGGVVEEIVKVCSFDFLKELEVNKQGVNFRLGDLVFNSSAYFRKGKVGDWKVYLNAEMAERIDKITQQKQHEYGLI